MRRAGFQGVSALQSGHGTLFAPSHTCVRALQNHEEELGEAMQKFVTGVGAKREHSQIEDESDQAQEYLLEVRRRSAHTEQYNTPLQQNLLTTAAVGMNAPG